MSKSYVSGERPVGAGTSQALAAGGGDDEYVAACFVGDPGVVVPDGAWTLQDSAHDGNTPDLYVKLYSRASAAGGTWTWDNSVSYTLLHVWYSGTNDVGAAPELVAQTDHAWGEVDATYLPIGGITATGENLVFCVIWDEEGPNFAGIISDNFSGPGITSRQSRRVSDGGTDYRGVWGDVLFTGTVPADNLSQIATA